MDALEARLADSQWLGGQLPSADDRDELEALAGAVPSPDTHPNTFAWWVLVSRFSDDVKKTWGAAAGGKKDAGKKGGKQEKKKEEPKAAAAAAAADEDDFDPFAEGGDDDGDLAEFEARMAEKAAAAKKTKKAVIAKSLVIWDVKGWDDTTDWETLAAKILAEVTMDGLVWKTEWKLEPIAFGLKKLQIGAVIEDDKVSTDAVAEKIAEFEDFVQSVDIAVFNKL